MNIKSLLVPVLYAVVGIHWFEAAKLNNFKSKAQGNSVN
jgi:hypothetical protein